jgi:hypothetical protein
VSGGVFLHPGASGYRKPKTIPSFHIIKDKAPGTFLTRGFIAALDVSDFIISAMIKDHYSNRSKQENVKIYVNGLRYLVKYLV